MKIQILFSCFIILLFVNTPDSFSEELDLSTNSKVYSPAHNLQVYGKGLPEENLIIRVFAPDESIAKFDQITTEKDGSFNYALLTWPQPSTDFPYGTYTVEVISTEQNGLSEKIDIKFSSTTDLLDVTVERFVNIPDSFSEELDLSTNSKVYSPAHNLQVYGKGLPEENLIIRVFAPDESIAKFDQITTEKDGSFNYALLTWPEPSTDFPYGTYTVEVISTEQNGASQKIDIKFSSSTDLLDVTVERFVNTLVFAPETAAIGQPIRVFVQTTSDGLLIGGQPSELLGTTHVHLPSGLSVTLTNAFKTLHQGLYYVDYTPIEEGTHVFHVVAFSQGTTSHGSAATNVLSQDLGGISDQIIKLNSILQETSGELDILKSEIAGFDSTLEQASNKIDESTRTISTSVEYISEASSQLNSLLFPIIASIGIIVALQITIIARRR